MNYQTFLNFIGVLAVSLCWGIGGPICYLVTRTLPAAETTFGRCFFAFLLLTPFLFTDGRKILSHLNGKGKALLAASGTILGIHFYFFVAGVAYASLSTAVMLVAVEPVLILVVGVVGFKEKLTLESVIGILLCVLGIGVISILPHYWNNDFAAAPAGRTYGDICAILAVVTYGVYYALNRSFRSYEQRLPQAQSSLRRGFGLASIIYFFTMASSGVIALFSHAQAGQDLPPLDGKIWISLIALGFIPTILGHTLNQVVSRRAHPVWVSLMSPGETLMSLLLGYLFLNQSLRSFDAVGGSMILVGVLITVWGEVKGTQGKAV